VQAAIARMASTMVTRAMRCDMASLRWVSGLTALGAKSNGRYAHADRICRQRRVVVVSGISGCSAIAAVRPLTHGGLDGAQLRVVEP
jgi:hypothetical protein